MRNTIYSVILIYLGNFLNIDSISPDLLDPFIEFETDSITINEGTKTTICLTITDGNFLTNKYKAEVKFNGSSHPHFPNFLLKQIDFLSNKYCFELLSVENHLIHADKQYQLLITPLQPNNLKLGPNKKLNILVKDINTRPTILSNKDLIIIGYDNKTDTAGTDKLILYNVIPITKGTKFTITDGIKDISDNWISSSGDTISSLELTYNDDTPIPSGTQITIELKQGNNGDYISLLENEARQPLNFTIANNGEKQKPSLNLKDQIYDGITIITGNFKANGLYSYLSGSLIDGIAFNTDSIVTQVNNTYDIITISNINSSFGFIECDTLLYVCEFKEYSTDIYNWNISNGTNNYDLYLITILNNCIISQCENGILEITDNCISDSSDIIFLLDNSSSTSIYEYSDMHESVVNTIYQISSLAPNTRFAITQFSYTQDFDISVYFTNNPNEASDFERAFAYGATDVGSAFQNVMNAIDLNALQLRPNTQFHLILYTDAYHTQEYSQYLLIGYTPYNSIKQSPYNASTSVIRYQGDYNSESNPVCGSISSSGGDYFGGLGQNSEDPDGISLPRRLYLAMGFNDPVPDLADDVAECNFLYANIDSTCANETLEWSATDGGLIISMNGSNIQTNGMGAYVLNIACQNDCQYTDTFNYQNNPMPLTTIQTNKIVSKVPDKAWNANQDYDKFNHEVIDSIKSSELSINVKPSLNNGIFKLIINSNRPRQVDILSSSLTGQSNEIRNNVQITKGYNEFDFDLSYLPPGLYIISLKSSNQLYLNKRFVIIN